MPERVVVALESVEVEEHEERRLHRVAVEAPREIVEQLPAVSEAGQRVGRGLLARQLEEAAVLAERDREPHDDEHERGRGESDREQVHADEVVVDEYSGRDQRTRRGNREERATVDLEALARAVGHPGRDCDQHEGGRPEDVNPGSLDIGAGGRLEEVDGVRERRREDAEAEEEPASTRPSAGEGEDADDRGQEQDVTERVGEVRDDGRCRSRRALEHELDEDRGAEGGRRQRRRDSVEPERAPDRPGARAKQQNEPDVEKRVEGDEPEVRHRRVGLGLEDRVPELAERPAADRDRDDRPGRSLLCDEVGVRPGDDAGENHQAVVDPGVEEREELDRRRARAACRPRSRPGPQQRPRTSAEPTWGEASRDVNRLLTTAS